jgi:hypothetical protein
MRVFSWLWFSGMCLGCLVLFGCQSYPLYQIARLAPSTPDVCYYWPDSFKLVPSLDYWVDPQLMQAKPLSHQDLVPPIFNIGAIQMDNEHAIKVVWQSLLKKIVLLPHGTVDSQDQAHYRMIATVPYYGQLRRLFLRLYPKGVHHVQVQLYFYGVLKNARKQRVWLRTLLDNRVSYFRQGYVRDRALYASPS